MVMGYDAVKDLLLRYAKRDQSVVKLDVDVDAGEDMAVDGLRAPPRWILRTVHRGHEESSRLAPPPPPAPPEKKQEG